MAIGPVPQVTGHHGCNHGIWEIKTSAELPVGTRGVLSDGRVYYYSRYSAAAAIGPGKLLCAAVLSAGHEDIACGTAAIGDTTLTITNGTAAITANQFTEGYCVVIDDTGEGVTYKIRSHPAISASTDGVLTFYDPVYLAFGADTTVCLVQNLWCDPVISSTDQADIPVGVSNIQVPIGSTTAQYFWCQTWGVAAVWQDEANAIGDSITIGTGVAGQVETVDAVAEPHLGLAVFTGTATEYQPVFLQIAP